MQCVLLPCVAVCCTVVGQVYCWHIQRLASWTWPFWQLKCVAVCCSVLQCLGVCYTVLYVRCTVLQCVAVDSRLHIGPFWNFSMLQSVAEQCNALQLVVMCCSVSSQTTVYKLALNGNSTVLQCVAVRCSVLQCVAVSRNVLQCVTPNDSL